MRIKSSNGIYVSTIWRCHRTQSTSWNTHWLNLNPIISLIVISLYSVEICVSIIASNRIYTIWKWNSCMWSSFFTHITNLFPKASISVISFYCIKTIRLLWCHPPKSTNRIDVTLRTNSCWNFISSINHIFDFFPFP